MNSNKLTKAFSRAALPSLLLVGGMLSSCEDDLLTGTPSWLGSSIYEELVERGNFTQQLALINDPSLSEYPRILQLTGSKTLFAADDATWSQFFANNRWGARSMSDLTAAQKKTILKSSMIGNAYLIELLSNKAGAPPTEGACVRRVSDASLYDSIPVVSVDSLPNTPQWAHLRATKKNVLLFNSKDLNDVPPMLHFLPDFMKSNNFTNEDISIITNNKLTSVEGGFINGQLLRENSGDVINRDITCQNGYIHIVEGVPVGLDNMAQTINTKPQFKIFSRMLERYSTPQAVSLYDFADGTQDSLYVKRYFNTGGSASEYITSATDAQPITKEEVLRMDPGWNNYVLDNQNNITYVSDAGCMLVPTDKALEEYGRLGGKPLLDRFGSWDNVPLGTLNKLINNHMQTSMNTVVPSKFYAVTNTAGDALGLTKEHVDSCFICCNGLVYQINTVFVAPEYEAVSFPTQVRLDLSMSKFASESTDPLLNFNAYLTATGSRYGFIVPNDRAYQTYVNPASFSNDKTSEKWAFMLKDNGKTKNLQVAITTTRADGKSSTKTVQSTQSDYIVRALRDIMQNHIIVLDKDKMFQDQQKIYTNMAGGPIRIDNANSWANVGTEKVHNIKVGGSQLMEKNESMSVDSVYVMGNGISMVVTDSILMTTRTTPYRALQANEAYSNFFALLDGSDLVKEKLKLDTERAYLGKGITVFNNYHYTVYVPSNESIEQMHTAHTLATWNDVEILETYATEKYAKPDAADYKDPAKYEQALAEYNTKKAQLDSLAGEWNLKLLSESDDEFYNDLAKKASDMGQRITDFLCYHIQDNAMYLEGAEQKNVTYETSCLDPLITNDEGDVISGTGRYRKLQVNYDYNDMTITPVWNGTPRTEYRRTVKPGANSNVVTRQYIYDSTQATSATYVYASSYVVIQEIDAPLYIDKTYVP